MRFRHFVVASACAQIGVAQKIWDIWQTTYNQKNLLKALDPRPPLQFGIPGATGTANIVVTDTSTYQQIVGFGGTLTDSSALLFSNLKKKNSTSYWNLLNYLFNANEAVNAAGFSYLRVPIGASDFAASTYSWDDSAADTCFIDFNIDNTPSYVFQTLNDIMSINPDILIHVLPWSPPGWMKTTNSMNGGTLSNHMVTYYANYLYKALQGFKSKGVNVYAITIQNEPLYSNPTYPTSTLTVCQEIEIGTKLKELMKDGFSSTKLIGFEHNWSDALTYPVKLIKAANAIFDGISFHCYSGTVSQQASFHKLYPSKMLFFTECSGVMGTDWWNDLKWYTDNVFLGAVESSAKTALMWNLALDGKGGPRTPGTNSCGSPGCRGIVTINSNGTWVVNQEFYGLAQMSKATIPRDIGGPSGRRIKTAVNGSASWALRVIGFVTERKKVGEELRYSLVVMNWHDSASSGPTAVKTTILFRGLQATYTFPVGISTLWWYAPALSTNVTDYKVHDETSEPEGTQLQFTDQSNAL